MIPGVDPKIDFAFKKVFGSEANTPLLIDLLHAVLNPPPEERIVTLEILNPFNEKDALTDKLSILDIKVRDAHGKLYNVEIQMAGSIAFPQRMLYYWALMYGRQLHESEDFAELRTTISICFLNSVLFPEVPDHHLDFQLRSSRHPELLFSTQQWLHVLELSKFRKTAEELAGPLDLWCYFLVHGAELDADKLPEALRVPPLKKAMEVLEMLTKNDREWLEYQSHLMAERDRRTRFKELLQKIEEAAQKVQTAQQEVQTAQQEVQTAQQEVQTARQEAQTAQQEAQTEGIIGRIHLCQRLLKQPVTPVQELAALQLPELRAMAVALEKQLGVGDD